ncbi:DUF423 domain-containing protein [Jiella mangrovi]|uniref:DUF423 domain-containing protein n=1 Tax=Jiella mangrovi TaxID=2821407 RepID=A0ABS4BKI0_9HYPH|nr:DUF423 domain-containing protein [Jiella mangrovi]
MSQGGQRVLSGLFILFAGLFGAAGVAGAALAAHGGGDGKFVAIAASMALFHGPALLGLAAVLDRAPRLLGLAGMAAIVGVVLFSGDLATRAAEGHSLFTNAAPTGGTMLIAGWLLVAVAGVLAMFRRGGAVRKSEVARSGSAPSIGGVTR